MAILILNMAVSSMGQVTGTLKDARDGETYKTVKIGTQTWMAENLAWKTGNGCFAYDDNESNVKTYGYLYKLGNSDKSMSFWVASSFRKRMGKSYHIFRRRQYCAYRIKGNRSITLERS